MKKILLLLLISIGLFGFTDKNTPNLSVTYKGMKSLTYIHNDKFDLLFSKKDKIPMLAFYTLTKEEILAKNLKRPYFHFDPRIDKKYQVCPTCYNYKKYHYDRGHFVSNDDFNYNKKYQEQTFYMTNIMPQTPAFNRIIWKNYEEFERNMAKKYGKDEVIDVVCGIKGKAPFGASIPKALAKIIYVPKKHKTYYIYVPNYWHFKYTGFGDYFVSKRVLEDRCNIKIHFNIGIKIYR